MGNTVTFLSDTFKNDKTGEDVQGITVIVDGTLKQVLDKIIAQSGGKYADYTSVLKYAVFSGINDIINELR